MSLVEAARAAERRDNTTKYKRKFLEGLLTDPKVVVDTSQFPAPKIDPLIGQRLGDFMVEELIATGGMGHVYRARHPLIGRQVAIKVLKPEIASDLEQTSRFLKEAQALSAIKHRGIIEIIGFGNTPDGRQYMATEFLEGVSLDRIISHEAPMPASRVLGLVNEILLALSAAHQCQVVHRDLKPSNVFLASQSTGERIVKLLDFGLAKQSPVDFATVNDGTLDKASLVAGTPEYIAPEQARGFAATPRTDLYCLGVIMYEMLSGTLPFKADGIVAMLKKHIEEPVPRLSGRVSNLPDELYELVEQLLQKDPEKRPVSAESVRMQVQRLIKRLQQELTVQGPAPVKTVAAPYSVVDSDAPTPKIDEKLKTTERVERFPVVSPTQFEEKKPWFSRVVAAVAVALLLLLAFAWFGSGEVRVETAEPPPLKQTKPVAVVAVAAPTEATVAPSLPVEEPKVEAPKVTNEKPAEVDPNMEPLPTLPTSVAKRAANHGVRIVAPTCRVNDQWRRGALAQMADLSRMASTRSVGTGVWFEKEEARVSQQIRAAETNSECAEVEVELVALQKKLESK